MDTRTALAVGLGLAVVILLLGAWVLAFLHLAFGPDPDLDETPRQARPEALPGCWPCTLYASASDDHLADHIRKAHAA